MFIGRKEEIKKIKSIINKNRRALISVFGRRGTGKTTFLFEINKIFSKDFTIFSFRGYKRESKKTQLDRVLQLTEKKFQRKADNITQWYQYFDFLLECVKFNEQKVLISIDEIAWLNTKNSGFIESFAEFYDNLIGTKTICIITTSAISWMNQYVFRTAGGLHSKASPIEIKPFNLKETVQYLSSTGLNNFQILEYYLFTGGVARYLEKIFPEQDILYNLKEIFYNPASPEQAEFDTLFDSIFENNKNIYKEIVFLFKKGNKKTILEIKEELESQGLSYSYPTVSNAVKELVVSKILTKKDNFGNKKKNANYFLTDLFCYFYVKMIEDNVINYELLDKENLKGLSFEIAIMLNTDLIKQQIGRSGFPTKQYSWSNKSAQIDLVLEYGQNRYSLIESKYYDLEYNLDRKETNNILNKRNEFLNQIRNSKKEMDIIIVSYIGIKNTDGRIQPLEVVISDLIDSYRI